MNKEQMQVLTVTMQVLKGVTTTLLALNPEAIPRIGPALRAFAAAPGLEPEASQILGNIAEGVEMIASARPSAG